MNKITGITFTALLLIIGLTSCLKEDPLTPNLLATGQADPIFIPNPGGGTGNPTPGGMEEFRFVLDGVAQSHPNPRYNGSSSFGQIVSQIGFPSFQIGVIGSTNLPDTNSLSSIGLNTINYLAGNGGDIYVSESGTIIFTENDSARVAGTFECILFLTGSTTDSLVVTDGVFAVNR